MERGFYSRRSLLGKAQTWIAEKGTGGYLAALISLLFGPLILIELAWRLVSGHW